MNFRRVVKMLIPTKLFRKVEPYGHLGEAVVLNTLSSFPARRLKVIGVTGTNGKTTTAFIIHKMMHEAGYKVGLMTTVAYGAGDDIRPQEEHMTNVPVPTMLKRLKWIKSQGVEWLVMETTSHALAQNRVWGLPYHLAVMTNVTQEHLDYHGTFDKYLAAKLRLFRLVNRNKRGLKTGVINADDPSAKMFEAAVAKPLTYGVKQGELQAVAISSGPAGSQFEVCSTTDETLKLNIQVNLPGRFNVYNALAAASVGLTLGMEPSRIEKGIAALKAVAGRMTAIDAGQAFGVIVDYAHSPDALKNVLHATKELTTGRVILVFGATGDRDKIKRPVMGEVAARYADKIYLTDDETYTEDPVAIRQAVNAGIVKAGGQAKTEMIEDRGEAIKKAFTEAKKGDTVILAGIGHQKDRNMGGRLEPWDEIAIAKKALGSRG